MTLLWPAYILLMFHQCAINWKIGENKTIWQYTVTRRQSIYFWNDEEEIHLRECDGLLRSWEWRGMISLCGCVQRSSGSLLQLKNIKKNHAQLLHSSISLSFIVVSLWQPLSLSLFLSLSLSCAIMCYLVTSPAPLSLLHQDWFPGVRHS